MEAPFYALSPVAPTKALNSEQKLPLKPCLPPLVFLTDCFAEEGRLAPPWKGRGRGNTGKRGNVEVEERTGGMPVSIPAGHGEDEQLGNGYLGGAKPQEDMSAAIIMDTVRKQLRSE